MQYTHQHPVYGCLVRVLQGVYEARPADLSETVRAPERYFVFFPVRTAVRRAFSLFKAGRNGNWWLWDGEREWPVGGVLTPEQRLLPIRQIWNDTMLKSRTRSYSANLARLLSVDPIVAARIAMRNPQGWNRYAYAFNSPTGYIDPDGRCAFQMNDGSWSFDQSEGCVEVTAQDPATENFTGSRAWYAAQEESALRDAELTRDADYRYELERAAFGQQRPWTLDASVSSPLCCGRVGGSAGLQFSESGVFWYIGAGYVSSAGWAVTLSPNEASAGDSDSAQSSVPILEPTIVGLSRPAGSSVADVSASIGVGTKGVSITRNRTKLWGHPVFAIFKEYAGLERAIRSAYGAP